MATLTRIAGLLYGRVASPSFSFGFRVAWFHQKGPRTRSLEDESGKRADRHSRRSASAKRHGNRREGICQKARISTFDGTLIDDMSLATPRIEGSLATDLTRTCAAKPR